MLFWGLFSGECVASDITRIKLVPGVFFTEAVIGAVLRASDSETAATAMVKSMDPFGVYIEIEDPADAVLDILNGGGQFVIFDNHFGSSSGGANTGGTWTSSYLTALPGAETTHLVCAGETFDGYMRGWQVQVNAAVPVYFDIAFATGDEIWVSGNVLGLVTANETEFCIIHPVGVNPENGATQTDPCQPESRYLWGGGYYLPPIVGFEMWHNFDFGVFGAQPGDNKSGQHYMWNRVYDIHMGRWTTPDPVISRWTTSFGYGGENPIVRKDPTGLALPIVAVAGGCILGALVNLTVDGAWEWFCDSEFTACEMFWSAALGCVAAFAPGLGWKG